MRSPTLTLAGTLCCLTTTLSPAAYANPLLTGAISSTNISAEQLTGASTSVPPISTDVLLGGSAYTSQSPTTAKRWRPSPVAARSVPTFWAISPSGTTAIASQPPAPTNTTAATATTSSESLPTLSPQKPEIKFDPETASTLLEEITADVAIDTQQENPAEVEERTTTDRSTLISRSLPPIQEIQKIQEDLRDLNIPEPVRRRRRVYPGITISNPSGYGAHRGQIFAGIGFQSRTRFSGGPNPGTIFGGGRRDGTAGIGFGIGDARRSVGLQVSYTAASFGGSRARFSGGLNAKVHKQFGNGWAAAIGGEGIVNIGRLPEDDDQIEFNDFENTYYSVVTKTFNLREDFTDPFSRLTLTGGVGSGRFRPVDKIVDGEFGVAPFGTAALQVLPSANLITEWTGQDLAVGVSVAPFPNFPLVFTPAIRDLAGEGDGNPRFVMGVGVSISDIFSILGL